MFSFNPPKPLQTTPTPEVEKRVFMNDPDMDKIAVHLISTQQRFRDNIIIPRIMGPVRIKTNEEKMLEATMESCAFKSIMSCVMGIHFSSITMSNVYFTVRISFEFHCIFFFFFLPSKIPSISTNSFNHVFRIQICTNKLTENFYFNRIRSWRSYRFIFLQR